MINKIIDGIIASLNEEFGDKYEFYPEDVEQGLNEPCFSIVCINPTSKRFFDNRYFKTNLFCIHYFPEGGKSEINDVTDRLFDCLEYIKIDDDLLVGTNMYGNMVDGVLHFFVNYDLFAYKEKEKTPFMETHTYRTDVKKG